MDWTLAPPEINSARMYAGPGPISLLQAAGSWETLAADLGSTTESFSQIVCGLTTADWMGPSSMAMMTAASRYQIWLSEMAALSEQTAAQAMAAVAAYEAAFAATVPPPVIAANRALLAGLVATNFLGINTPAIAATEAQYAEMWSQDVAAMAEYQMASAQATQLPQFPALRSLVNDFLAAPVSNLTGTVQNVLGGFDIFAPGSNTQTTGLAGLLNLVSGSTGSAFGSFINANQFSSGYLYGIPVQGLQALTQFVGLGSLGQGQQQIDIAQQNQPPSPQPNIWPIPQETPPSEFSPATATLGQAQRVGQLTVPPSWASSIPASSTAEPLTPLSVDETPFVGVPGVPLLGGRREGSEPARYGIQIKKVTSRHPSAG